MERTDPETTQDSPEGQGETADAPRESSIVSEPATVEACAADFATGAAIRKSLDDRVRRYRDR